MVAEGLVWDCELEGVYQWAAAWRPVPSSSGTLKLLAGIKSGAIRHGFSSRDAAVWWLLNPRREEEAHLTGAALPAPPRRTPRSGLGASSS